MQHCVIFCDRKSAKTWKRVTDARIEGYGKAECLVRVLIPACGIERFSVECRKTNTKVMTPGNHSQNKLPYEPVRTRSKYM